MRDEIGSRCGGCNTKNARVGGRRGARPCSPYLIAGLSPLPQSVAWTAPAPLTMEVRLIHRRLLLEDRLLFDWCLAIADINAEIAPASRIVLRILPKGWRGHEHCGQEPGIIDGLHRTLFCVAPASLRSNALENRALTLDKVDRALWGKPRTLS